MIWFLENPGRLAAERRAISELEGTADWLAGTRWGLDGMALCLDAILRVGDREFPVRMTYPELFPATPPAVRPQQAGEHWSRHQYGDGTLCLEWGPDTWHEGVTGRDMLESAYRLLTLENTGPHEERRPAPSRHFLTQGQSLRSETARVYIGPALLDKLRGLTGGGGKVTYCFHLRRQSYLVVILSVQSGDSDSWNNPEVPRGLREESASLHRTAAVRQVPLPGEAISAFDTVAEANEFLKTFCQPELADRESLLLLDRDRNPHFLLRFSSGDKFYPIASVRSGDTTAAARLAPEFEQLAGRSVGIVGLGSAGSKLAASLVRSGVGRFFLVDEDVFLPENVTRNALDLHDTGEHKVDAVADLLYRISTSVQVEVSHVHLTGQESNAAVSRALGKLGKCDLVIDATADPQVFNLLAAVARSGRKPLLWLEVFAGGVGGMVARSRPGADPSPAVVRRAFHQFTVDHPASDIFPAGDYGAALAGRILAASDADVGVIAAIAAQLALDTLLAREPSAFPHSLYLIGLARAWVFEAPLQVVPIATDHLRGADTPAAPDPGQLDANVEFLKSLFLPAEPCE